MKIATTKTIDGKKIKFYSTLNKMMICDNLANTHSVNSD